MSAAERVASDGATGRQRMLGKVVLVTGAARGQGRSHAVRMAAEGADVIAIDLCQDIASTPYPLATHDDLRETARLVRSHGRRVVTSATDVRERSAMIEAVATGVAELGGLHVAVANAGVCPLGADAPPQAFLDAVSVDLVGVINTIEAALPYLGAGSSIVAIGSVAGLMTGTTDQSSAGPGGAGYSHAKRAVARLVHDLANQLAPHAIRVNAVHPGNCRTPMLENDAMYRTFRPDLEHPTADDAEVGFRGFMRMPVPWVEPDDISDAVLYLASDEARYVTGAQLRVDAGAALPRTTSGAH